MRSNPLTRGSWNCTKLHNVRIWPLCQFFRPFKDLCIEGSINWHITSFKLKAKWPRICKQLSMIWNGFFSNQGFLFQLQFNWSRTISIFGLFKCSAKADLVWHQGTGSKNGSSHFKNEQSVPFSPWSKWFLFMFFLLSNCQLRLHISMICCNHLKGTVLLMPPTLYKRTSLLHSALKRSQRSPKARIKPPERRKRNLRTQSPLSRVDQKTLKPGRFVLWACRPQRQLPTTA